MNKNKIFKESVYKIIRLSIKRLYSNAGYLKSNEKRTAPEGLVMKPSVTEGVVIDQATFFVIDHGAGRNKKKPFQADSLKRLEISWGERWDLNPRPPRPQPGATNQLSYAHHNAGLYTLSGTVWQG